MVVTGIDLKHEGTGQGDGQRPIGLIKIGKKMQHVLIPC